MTERKPKITLEVGREYKLMVLPYIHWLASDLQIDESSLGRATYLGHVNKGHHLDMHVFVKEKKGQKIYAFFDDYWVKKVDELIYYSPISSDTPQFRPAQYFKEELPERLEKDDPSTRHIFQSESDLLNALKQLGEKI